MIMQAFSREALQCYVPVIAEEVSNYLEQWLSCGERGLLVYPQVKRLMFRIAMRILLGCESRLASGGQLDGHEFEQAPGVGDGQGSLACCSPWGCNGSDVE